ncbi:MAG: hypothetical protein ACTHPD_04770 [Rhizomicrobium sp.]
MTDYEDMKRGTAREWFWARVVLAGGFAVAVAVAGYFAWQQHEAKVAAEQQQTAALAEAAQQKPRTVTPEQARADENAKLGVLICAMELLNAKNMGVIPPYGEIASAQPRATATKNRLMCLAATQVSKYEIQADLLCRTLTNPNCMKLHSVKSDDGTVLYENKS